MLNVSRYSGITPEMLAPITTRLSDIQKTLLGLLDRHTILIGHSLNSDLTALKLTHPFIIDTAVAYPHPRGPPLKSSLKWLAQKYMGREIQKGDGQSGPSAGHDSVEDARTCLDLMKQKCEKGPDWGTGSAQGENIFKRVAAKGVRYRNHGGAGLAQGLQGRSSAAIDWGDPRKGPGGGATFAIGCRSDDDVFKGVLRAVNGDDDGKEIPGPGVDFVWARFRELEDLKEWNNIKLPRLQALELEDVCGNAGMEAQTQESSPSPEQINAAAAALTNHVKQIWEALPLCTAFVVYSGSGDPREMSRLQSLHTQFKNEYKFKKWDELSVKWTDVEEQALKKAMSVARAGIGFIAVK